MTKYSNTKHVSLEQCNNMLKSIGKDNKLVKFLYGEVQIMLLGQIFIYSPIKTTDPSYCSKVLHSYFKNTEYFDLLSKYTEEKVCNIGDKKYINEKYLEKKLICYSYDVNSSYAFACQKKLPTELLRYNDFKKDGDDEVGFNFAGKPHYESGCYRYIFKCEYIKPLIDFANDIYFKKKNAKDKAERTKYKDILNIAIGCLANKNKFIRNAIVDNSMTYVESMRDKDTILSNIDSIVSLKERKDLPIGEELGQFKIEHTKENFYMTKFAYQWNLEKPKYAGLILESSGNDLSKNILNIKEQKLYNIKDKGAYYEIL